jgi:hypothetical protein
MDRKLAYSNTEILAKLGADLRGPVALELARAEEQLPRPNGMPGASRYDLKWDGFLY